MNQPTHSFLLDLMNYALLAGSLGLFLTGALATSWSWWVRAPMMVVGAIWPLFLLLAFLLSKVLDLH